jgi:HAMP domain-containing protein
MNTTLTVAIVSVAFGAGLFILRGLVRRFRRLRRLERAAESVAEAMADGRLPAAAGEALLQHLDGLRRTCARWREG